MLLGERMVDSLFMNPCLLLPCRTSSEGWPVRRLQRQSSSSTEGDVGVDHCAHAGTDPAGQSIPRINVLNFIGLGKISQRRKFVNLGRISSSNWHILRDKVRKVDISQIWIRGRSDCFLDSVPVFSLPSWLMIIWNHPKLIIRPANYCNIYHLFYTLHYKCWLNRLGKSNII